MITFKKLQWYRYQGALLPRAKPHTEIHLSQEEQQELLKLSKAYFLRWCDEWDRGEGAFWYVIKDQKEDLSAYKSKVRNQIKKGLKNTKVQKVDKTVIAENGYEVYANAFKGYSGYHQPVSKEDFMQNIKSSSDDFWAVYDHGGRLIAYANNILEEDVCHYNSMKFDPKYLSLYPSYALLYTMNHYYLNEQKFRYVNDGARSIAHETNIQEFLIRKFHFRKAYCRLHVAYRQDIKMMIRLFYPFLSLIEKIPNHLAQKMTVLLTQEKIRRSFE